jgi:hypothetical protein
MTLEKDLQVNVGANGADLPAKPLVRSPNKAHVFGLLVKITDLVSCSGFYPDGPHVLLLEGLRKILGLTSQLAAYRAD